MAIVLGANAYGKAECRVVRVVRHGTRHEISDRNVSTALHGDFDAAHISGDQANVLPTDTQKNTVYAFAADLPEAQPEEFALALARHFVDDVTSVNGARVRVEQFAWDRASVEGQPHEHTFVRRGQEVRTATATVESAPAAAYVVSGLEDLVLLKSTGSEFSGFLTDGYTTLAPTADRVMATSLSAHWRYRGHEVDWQAAYDGIRAALVERYAAVHSLALQQTLWEMGRAVLERFDDVLEIRLTAPNKHHFAVDLAPFGRTNENDVFFASDRPYGLISANVERDDMLTAEVAWNAWPPPAAGRG